LARAFCLLSLFPPLIDASRFDHISNQWNCSDKFNIKDNVPSDEPAPPNGGFDEIGPPEPYAELSLPLEEGELMPDPSELPPKKAVSSPIFNNQSLRTILAAPQFSFDVSLVDTWSNGEEFLWKRYGLVGLSNHVDTTQGKNIPMGLGLCQGSTDAAVAALLNSVAQGTPLPSDCDLSEGYASADAGFPLRSPNSVLSIRQFERGYLVVVGDDCPWKLFIEDPLTVIQIEREGWHLQRDGLVLNLIQKGLPFQILYPSRQHGAGFHPHSGPVAHPHGKAPTFRDYQAYRLDIADFFTLYPHAYAAALCSGGILWRIAIDALPLPAERQIIRPFHSRACSRRTVDGQRYWTPTLTEPEEEVIVGVYRWARKSHQENSAGRQLMILRFQTESQGQ